MKKEDLTSIQGLSEEQITAIVAASTEELKGFVPLTRFTEVNERMKSAESTVKDRDKSIEDLGKSNGDVEALRKQITDLTTANATAMQEKEAEIQKIKVDTAINDALKGANARNIKAVRALLDLESTEFEADGTTIKGLSKRIQELQESKEADFLFEKATKQTTIAGATPATKTKSVAGDVAAPTNLRDAIASQLLANKQD